MQSITLARIYKALDTERDPKRREWLRRFVGNVQKFLSGTY